MKPLKVWDVNQMGEAHRAHGPCLYPIRAQVSSKSWWAAHARTAPKSGRGIRGCCKRPVCTQTRAPAACLTFPPQCKRSVRSDTCYLLPSFFTSSCIRSVLTCGHSLQFYLQRFLLKMVYIGLKVLLSAVQAHCSVFFSFIWRRYGSGGERLQGGGISDGLLCLQWILWQL